MNQRRKIEKEAKRLWDSRCNGAWTMKQALRLIQILDQYGSKSLHISHPLHIPSYGGKPYDEVLINNALFKEAERALQIWSGSSDYRSSATGIAQVQLFVEQLKGIRFWETTKGILSSIARRLKTRWCGYDFHHWVVDTKLVPLSL